MTASPKRNCRSRYLVCTVWIALVLLAAASQGPAGVVAVFFLVIAIPLVAWILVRRIRIPERLLSQFVPDPKSSVRYFFDESPKSTTNVEWRTFEVMLSVLGISALLADRLVRVTSGSSLALGVFVSLVVIVASISGLALIPVWIFEDSGFRRQSVPRSTITIPLARVKSLFVFGGLGAYLSFASGIAGTTSGAAALTLVLLFLLFPITYLITILFHDKMEDRTIERLTNSEEAKRIPRSSIRVE